MISVNKELSNIVSVRRSDAPDGSFSHGGLASAALSTDSEKKKDFLISD